MQADAILFSLAAFSIYLVAMLAVQDWRWHLGRIIQFLLLGGVAVLLYWRRSNDFDASVGLLSLFLLFAVIPTILEQRLAQALVVDADPGPMIWLALRLLMWGRNTWALRTLRRGVRASGVGDRQAADRLFHAVINAPHNDVLRRRYLAYVISTVFRRRRFTAAAHFFESYPELADEASPGELYTMARAYAELRDFERALDCLQRGEDHQQTVRTWATERLLAGIAVFALAGDVEAVEDRLKAAADSVRALPAPMADYWRGIAWLARGDRERAEECFARAVPAEGADAATWRLAIAGRVADADDLAAQAAVARAEFGVELARARERIARPQRRQAPLFSLRPEPLTLVLLAVNVAVWVLMEVFGGSTAVDTLLYFGANVPLAMAGGQYWRLVSSMFIHVGIAHLMLNGMALYLFGAFIERWSGRRGMFVVYMLAGIGGSAASAWMAGYATSAGASGAISGLLGAAIVILLRFQQRFPPHLRRLYLATLVYIAALQLVYGGMQPAVDNNAHVGGFVVGMAVGLLLNRPWFRFLQRPLSWALVALLAACGVAAAENARHRRVPYAQPPMRLYIDPSGDFGIYVPVNWMLHARTTGSATFVDTTGVVRFTVRRLPPGTPLPEQHVWDLLDRRRLDALMADRKVRGALQRPEQLRLGAHTFYEWKLEEREGNVWIAMDRYFCRDEGQVYEFAFECEAGLYRWYRPVFRQALATFRTLSPAVKPVE